MTNNRFRIITCVLLTMIILIVNCAAAFAATITITFSGICGDNLEWELKDHVLTISGSGPMYNFKSAAASPFYGYTIQKIIIKQGTTSLGSHCFHSQTYLTEISIPNSVTRIGAYAFADCDNLKNIPLPGGITSLGVGAFQGCGALQSIALPMALKTIESGAFKSCYSLQSIQLPAGLTSLEDRVFYRCTGLESVSIPASITSFGEEIFYECTKLNNVAFEYGCTTAGGPAMFQYCTGLNSIVLPATIRTIPEDAFGSCKGLVNIVLPSELESIDRKAFFFCTALTEIAIPGKTTTIGYMAFDSCSALKKVIIPDSVVKIEQWAFSKNTTIYSSEESYAKIWAGKNDIPWVSTNPPPTPQILAFVMRCYMQILNRGADAEGLNNWGKLLAARTSTASQIIYGFIQSDEFKNRNLSYGDSVDILYLTMLNRTADAGGKAGWVDALNQGYTLANIIDGFCGSTEFVNLCNSYGIEPGSIGAPTPASPSSPRGKIEAFVKRCYQLILNRAADEGGLKGWSDALEGKTAAAAQIIDGFVRSPEYINRSLTSDQSVTILYKTMLDREPDEGGKAGWVDALSKGYTLQHIINGFCGSAEFTKICSDYGIEAGSVAVPVQSAAALEAAAQLEAKKLPDERIGNAVSADDAGITVVNGYEPAEVEAFVKHAYRAALGREADEVGLAGWTEQIVSGAAAPKAFLRTLLFSDEQIARKLNNEQFIEMLYRLYLNRGMDDAAAERIAQLAAGGLDEVIKGFEGSAEFRLVLNGFGL